MQQLTCSRLRLALLRPPRARFCSAAPAPPAPPALPPPPPPTASRLLAMLAHNAAFVGRREFERYNVSSESEPEPEPDASPPAARLAAAAAAPRPSRCVVVSCMDARLTTLLPHALGILPGDGKLIKNAGAIISAPFGGIMRSVIVALYELGATEVFVVGHHDCGMAVVQPTRVIERMVREGGITRETLQTLEAAGIDVKRWLAGFANVGQSVRESVGVIRNHPLVPRRVPVSGLIIDPHTGRLEVVIDGPRAVAEAGSALQRDSGGGGGGSAATSDFHSAQWSTAPS